MANTVQLKRSAVPGKVPTTSDLALGEIGINTFDGKVYIKRDNGTPSIIEIGAGGASVGGSDTQVLFNDGGSINGDAGLTYNKTTDALTVAGSLTAASLIPSGTTVPSNGLYLPAANSIGLSTGTSERLRVDSSGRLLVGSATTVGDAFNPVTGVRVAQFVGSSSSFGSHRNDNTSFSNACIFTKARGTGYTAVLADDTLGILSFQSADGSTFNRNAEIQAFVDGTPGAGSAPGRLVFYTTPAGSGTPSERMRIRSDGGVAIGGTGSSSVALHLQRKITGFTSSYSAYVQTTVAPDVTGVASGFFTQIGTDAGTYTTANLAHYVATQGTIGAGSAVTDQQGFVAASSLIGGTNNYGFYSEIPNGTNRFSFFSTNGSADSYFGGNQFFVAPGGSTMAYCSSSGLLVGGITSARTFDVDQTAIVPRIQAEGTTYSASAISATRNSAGAQGSSLILAKSRGTTNGSNAILLANDVMGQLVAQGTDGTNFEDAADIRFVVDGTPANNIMPARIEIRTRDAVSTVGPSERVRIDSSGNVGIGTTSISERLTVSGNVAGNAFIPADSTVPVNGLYLPATNTVGISAGTTEKVRVDTNGLQVSGSARIASNNLAASSYTTVSLDISAQETAPTGIFFSPDGLNMYVTGTTGDDVNWYSLSTAWVVSTATFNSVFSVSGQDTAPADIYFRSDGLKMYLLGATNSSVFSYSLRLPWQLNTATYDGISFSASAQDTTCRGLFFHPNGTSFYVLGATNDTVFRYNIVGNTWNISVSTLASSFSVATQETDPHSLSFSADGTQMYVIGNAGDDINIYRLSTPWDITTATFVTTYSGATENNAPQGLYVSPDNSKFYTVRATAPATVFQYSSPLNTVEVTGRTEFFGDVRVDQALAVDGGVTTNTVQAYNRVNTAYVTTAPVSGFRNALINPNFSIWQRGNSFAVTTATGYCADRWGWSRTGTGSTLTISRQSFTAGQQDVPDEPEFFLRYDQTVAGTTATSNDLFQRIEDVRTFAGQQVTLTFYAKAAAAINIGTVILTQNFGAGGTVSGAVTTNVATNVAIGTTWSKYTLTFNVPSIATRNIGTTPNTSYLQLAFRLPLNAVFTFDIAQVQMEASPAATAFERRPIGVELALCQRYYYRIAPGATTRRFGSALTASTTTGRALTFFPVTMRVAPTALEQSGTAADYAIAHVLTVTVLSAVPVFSNATTQAAVSNLTVASGLTAGQAAEFYTNSINAFVAWSAEL